MWYEQEMNSRLAQELTVDIVCLLLVDPDDTHHQAGGQPQGKGSRGENYFTAEIERWY